MKATAKAPANIAFIKFWGKKDEKLRLPVNGSVSMNLSNMFSTTEVEFDRNLKSDVVRLDNMLMKGDEITRVSNHLDRVRKLAKIKSFARVISNNNFPKGTGIASSASGFAALTLAAAKAANLNLSDKEHSILARLGSGSACRSIPDGFVEWKKGTSDRSSFARSIYPPNYWDIYDLIVVCGKKSKKTSSTEGHTLANSSPFFKLRVASIESKIKNLKMAMKKKDFSKFGQIIEEEAINMHAVMMTSTPPLFYWVPETLNLILSIQDWRRNGLEVYFTIDAGPNIHLICEGKNYKKVIRKLQPLGNFENVVINRPAIGARIVGNL